jgi:hypothetical protein
LPKDGGFTVKEIDMELGKLGFVGALMLAGYLIIVGITMLFGVTAIPAWFIGLLAVSAGVLILVGR